MHSKCGRDKIVQGLLIITQVHSRSFHSNKGLQSIVCPSPPVLITPTPLTTHQLVLQLGLRLDKLLLHFRQVFL